VARGLLFPHYHITIIYSKYVLDEFKNKIQKYIKGMGRCHVTRQCCGVSLLFIIIVIIFIVAVVVV